MIKTLEINNYQSHKKSILNFHPGVNVVVGTSDSGKSAVLRALRWVCTGVPRGDGFRSHWGGDTEVSLETDNCIVTRGKTNSDNVYVLNETEFRAFGTDVPEEIIAALNLDEAVNIQKQLDQPYLISETPGNVAQHFNRMAHLEKIDIGLKNVQSQIRATEQSIQSKTTELKQVEEDKTSYIYLEAAEQALIVLETRQGRLEELEDSADKLQDLIQDIVSIDQKILRAEKPLQAEKSLDYIIGVQNTLDKEKRLENSLKMLVEDIETVEERITKANRYISGQDAVESLLEKVQDLKVAKNSRGALKLFVENLEEVFDLEQTQKASLTAWQQEYEENMPEICPLCGDANCKH
jgi:hypothetical protein